MVALRRGIDLVGGETAQQLFGAQPFETIHRPRHVGDLGTGGQGP
jgi:hypothetical protein